MWVVEITKTTGWINYIDVYALREQRAEKLRRCSRRLPGREIFISCLLYVDTITILYFVYATELLMEVQWPPKLTLHLRHYDKNISTFIMRRSFVAQCYIWIDIVSISYKYSQHTFNIFFFFLTMLKWTNTTFIAGYVWNHFSSAQIKSN